ncbi:hypothetical protein [Microvirga alba]|uniref:Alpha/beta hydrolase n=1 Tax=Microvirga alba TaxID=2791025 RepID=A0A931BQ30_9HYPH|nr:hypothetical protein [Microvirga alba]MBF9232473.1 hypothetical protein [Microvirga alba]
MKQSTLAINGYRDLSLPNGLTRQDGPSRGLAILFPGFGYRNTMPALYYCRQLLLARGHDVLTVDYTYDLMPDFLAAPQEERLGWIKADAQAALGAALALGGYEHFTVIGKSAGTAAMAYTIPDEPRLAKAELVWLTPGFKTPGVPEGMARCPQRSILVIGTADYLYDEGHLQAARDRGVEVVLVPDLDHGLEIPGRVTASVAAMGTITERLSIWLGGEAQLTRGV